MQRCCLQRRQQRRCCCWPQLALRPQPTPQRQTACSTPPTLRKVRALLLAVRARRIRRAHVAFGDADTPCCCQPPTRSGQLLHAAGEAALQHAGQCDPKHSSSQAVPTCAQQHARTHAAPAMHAATQSLWGVSPEQVQQLGVGAPWVQAAADARSKFRESLLGDAAAGSELAARLGNGTLLPRLLSSGMPLKLSADGACAPCCSTDASSTCQPRMPRRADSQATCCTHVRPGLRPPAGKGIELPGLQAIGVFLSQRVQEALKGGAAGLAGTPGGRRLLEVRSTRRRAPSGCARLHASLQAQVLLPQVQDNGDDEQDTASGDTLLQVLHNIERIRGYMARLATAAGDALDAEAAVSAAQRAADGEFEDDEGAALQGSQRRRLQQPGRPLGGPLGGLDGPLGDEADNKDYGDAIRLIFTNIFDLFRANGAAAAWRDGMAWRVCSTAACLPPLTLLHARLHALTHRPVRARAHHRRPARHLHTVRPCACRRQHWPLLFPRLLMPLLLLHTRRYNFIADLFNILDAPLENFVNANYWPLPQVGRMLLHVCARTPPRSPAHAWMLPGWRRCYCHSRRAMTISLSWSGSLQATTALWRRRAAART